MKEEAKTFTLPSGAVVKKRREGKGKDIFTASEMVKGNNQKMGLAFVSLLYEIDGKQMPIEDIEELPLKDVMKLLELATDDFL